MAGNGQRTPDGKAVVEVPPGLHQAGVVNAVRDAMRRIVGALVGSGIPKDQIIQILRDVVDEVERQV